MPAKRKREDAPNCAAPQMPPLALPRLGLGTFKLKGGACQRSVADFACELPLALSGGGSDIDSDSGSGSELPAGCVAAGVRGERCQSREASLGLCAVLHHKLSQAGPSAPLLLRSTDYQFATGHCTRVAAAVQRSEAHVVGFSMKTCI